MLILSGCLQGATKLYLYYKISHKAINNFNPCYLNRILDCMQIVLFLPLYNMNDIYFILLQIKPIQYIIVLYFSSKNQFLLM